MTKNKNFKLMDYNIFMKPHSVQIISKNLKAKVKKNLNEFLYLAPEQMQFINLDEKQ